MNKYSLKDIFNSPDEDFDGEFNDILIYINSPSDNPNSEKTNKDIKELINNYKRITNKILLLKIYQMNNQIIDEDLIISEDPIFESYVSNALLYEKKTIPKILEDIKNIKNDSFHPKG